jgi:PD-(D/E)XK nuclease superfamily
VSDDGALRLSWSRLRLHDECPAKGDLMRRHKSPVQDIRNFFHGNVVDLAMRRWLSQEEPEPGWMSAQVDAIFEESADIAKDTGDGVVHWRSATDRAETLDFCRELVARLEPALARYALPFTWEPAVRFAVPVAVPYLDGRLREIILVGEMDLLVTDCEGRIAVWDLKATRDNNYYKKVLGQLAFYAIAVKLMKGQFPAMTGLIQPMCETRVLPVTVDRDAVAQMAGRMTKAAQDIWAGRLAPKADNAGCAYCPVKHACPKFSFGGKPGRMSLAAA